jgi:hypothetical protein
MVTTDNLVSYYKLDESSGDAIDSHGSNDGTVNGATQGVTGKINNCYSFDGVNDNVQINDVTTSDGTWSVSLWFNSSASDADKLLFDSYSSGSNRNSIRHIAGGNFEAVVYNVAYKIDDWSNVNDGEWHHVVVINNNSGILVYLDNDKKIDTTGTASDIGTVTAIASNRVGSSTNPFDGKIDEVGIWDRALDGTDVSDLYNGGAGLAYPFAEEAVAQLLNIQDGLNQFITYQ